jgi:hypothetical protein
MKEALKNRLVLKKLWFVCENPYHRQTVLLRNTVGRTNEAGQTVL